MIRTINAEQQEILTRLSNKYLKSKDTSNSSIEVEDATETTVYFWYYEANAEDGDRFDLPWLQFIMFQLFPVLFKSQLFKFNSVAARYFFRTPDTREDLFQGMVEMDAYLQEKKKNSPTVLAEKGKEVKEKHATQAP